MIVVTAPTGNIGRKLLSHLVGGPEPIRVIARDPARLDDAVRAAVDVVEGSHADPAVLDRAFDGARAVFWLVAADPRADSADAAYVEFSRTCAAALSRRGVRQVVAISAVGRGWKKEAGHIGASVRMEDLLRGSGAAVRALACASLMENVLRQAAAIRDKGVYSWPTPRDAITRHVASADVAAVAARLLADPSWSGFEDVPLLGPEDLTHAQMMAIAGDVLGRPIAYQEMAMDDLRDAMVARGASAGMAGAMVAMMIAKNEGVDDLVARTPAITALTPTSFARWCEETLRPAVS